MNKIKSSTQHNPNYSSGCLQEFQIDPSKVDGLTRNLLQNNPSKCVFLFYRILSLPFRLHDLVVQYLRNLRVRINTYSLFARSLVCVQDVAGGMPRIVKISGDGVNSSFSSANVEGMASPGKGSKLIRRLPRRRHLRLVRFLILAKGVVPRFGMS